MRAKLVRLPGRRKWYIQWSENGKLRRKSTGCEDHKAAQALLDDWALDRAKPSDDDTLALLIDRYMETLAHKPSHGNTKYIADAAKREFGDLCRRHLTDARVYDYIGRMKDKPTMARRVLEVVRTATGLRVPMPAKRPPRERYLTLDEAQRLLEASDGTPHVKLFIQIALATGARMGAILDLTWSRVDLERGRVDFRNPERGETKKRRGIARIPSQLVAALAQAREIAISDHVIEWRGKPVQRMKRAFNEACREAGVQASPHVLKHTAISWMAEQGWSVDQIADQTETDPQTVRRIYRKFNPDYLAEEVERFGNYVFGESRCDSEGVGENGANDRIRTGDPLDHKKAVGG